MKTPMKLAVNLSDPSMRLLKEGKVRFDLFKSPSWPETVAQARTVWPCYVHFSMLAGSGCAQDSEADLVADLLEKSDTPHVNMHLAPRQNRFADIPLETSDPSDKERLIEAMLADIGFFARRFGKENIVLENHPWSVRPKTQVPRPVVEPAVISRVVREAGCNFLLDIAHASIAAKYLGMDPHEYIFALPVDRVREIHVSGTISVGNNGWEDHYALSPEDWALTEWVVGQIRDGVWPCPWGLVFEYGGIGEIFAHRSDPNVLAEQLPRLWNLAKSV